MGEVGTRGEPRSLACRSSFKTLDHHLTSDYSAILSSAMASLESGSTSRNLQIATRFSRGDHTLVSDISGSLRSSAPGSRQRRFHRSIFSVDHDAGNGKQRIGYGLRAHPSHRDGVYGDMESIRVPRSRANATSGLAGTTVTRQHGTT